MVSAGPLSGFMGFGWPLSKAPPRPTAPWIELWWALAWFRLAPCLVLWDFKTDGWPLVPISKAPPGPGAPWIELRRALAWFRLATCLVLWDFKTDGWPPVRILKIPPRPRTPPWIELWRALAWFRLPVCLVLWDLDGPLSRSQRLPQAQELLGLSCGGL